MVKVVIWSKKAQNQLFEAYKYIQKDSQQSAEKVKNEILKSTNLLSINF